MRTLALIGLAGAMAAGCGWTPRSMDREELVAEPSACGPKRFDVYFADGEARLTNAALQAIGLTATQLQECEIRRVRVSGLADATGGESANLSLSQRRAIAVTEALAASGWPTPVFEVEAVGETDAVNPDGTREPLRRRTVVLVDAAPR